MMDKKALIELGKSFARFMWFGLLGLVGTFLAGLLTSGQLENIYVHVGDLYINISFVILAVITGIVKAIDKYVHESKAIPSNGIAPSFLQK
jgi:hypothetical protein